MQTDSSNADFCDPSELLILSTTPDNKLLKVVQPKTKFLETMGSYSDRFHWMHPLEAVYLVSTNNAIIKHNEVPLTYQECLYLLEYSETPWFYYEVYKILKERGYFIRITEDVYFDIYNPEGYSTGKKNLLPKYRVVCRCDEQNNDAHELFKRLSKETGAALITATVCSVACPSVMTDVETPAPAVDENAEKEETPMAVAQPPVADEQQASSSSADAQSVNKEGGEDDTLSSTADSEATKKSSRSLAVEVTHFQIEPSHIIEYEWPERSGDRYFLQEQIAELLDVKSFKRKYPSMYRRNVEPDEREFLENTHKLKSNLPSHLLSNITALKSADVHDLMAQEYPEQHAKYQKVVVDRRRREQRNALTNKVDKRPLAERMKEAVQEAASYNKEFNTWRAPGYMDIQTMVCQYPKNKFYVMPKEKTKPSAYPCALIHGQYSEYYKRISPAQLKKIPFGTVCDSTDLFPVRRERSPPSVSVSEQEQAVLDAAAAAEAANEPDTSPEVKKEKLEAPPVPTPQKTQGTPGRKKAVAPLVAENAVTPANKRKRGAPGSTGQRGRPKRVKKEESEEEEEVSEDEEKVTSSGRRPVRSCATRKSYAKLLIDE
ncbi:hypothetical protein QR680_006851 [Steinernema hermaphroditum]|uniref:tRNA-splicing endonuclease subunit Sen54 N-terminal domain-containing protein n=1 Tax=Steinernema hermaphroditum TaxID=289476 RepID=A0AA39HXY3_9BILA|nr:hypothetical protein QR680_006851 [Steinernema hermaphroditum]